LSSYGEVVTGSPHDRADRSSRQRPSRALAAPGSSVSTDQLDTGDDVDVAPVVGVLEIGDDPGLRADPGEHLPGSGCVLFGHHRA
jgi:hypothetical protein